MKVNSLLIIFLFITSSFSQFSNSYDIEGVYEGRSVDYGTFAKTSMGEIVEIEEVFVKTNIDPGKYSVTVTRKGNDLYKIDGYNLYVKTRYCYEYSYSQEAILDVSTFSGYSFGTIIFK